MVLQLPTAAPLPSAPQQPASGFPSVVPAQSAPAPSTASVPSATPTPNPASAPGATTASTAVQPPAVTVSKTIFDAGAALLAFVLAFYALALRERKTPYAANSVYGPALAILLAISVALVSTLVRLLPPLASAAPVFDVVAGAMLVWAAGLIFWRLASMHSRHVNFNDHVWKNTWLYRKTKARSRKKNAATSYEHIDQPVPEGIWTELEKILGSELAPFKTRTSVSIGLSVDSLRESDDLLIPIAASFLANERPVQYTTCLRHPSEFVEKLKTFWEEKKYGKKENWKTTAARLVIVDAYTAHFGFTDSIHRKRSEALSEDGVHYILSPPSYAGVHTAASTAFNTIKDHHGPQRPATLLLYEGPQALVDLESREQYHIFVRHVIPSERMWGGMVTLFVECGVEPKDLTVLRSYCDVFRAIPAKEPKK